MLRLSNYSQSLIADAYPVRIKLLLSIHEGRGSRFIIVSVWLHGSVREYGCLAAGKKINRNFHRAHVILPRTLAIDLFPNDIKSNETGAKGAIMAESIDNLRSMSMQISMYSAAVPPFVRILNNLIVILEKAQSHADARKIEPGVLLASRLYPDMYPLLKQVQIATDNAKGAAARLAGIAPPVFADIETTFPELIHRVHKTVAFLQSLTSAQIDGSEERLITLTFPSLTLEFKGLNYLLDFAQPNVHFHITTAYAILRHNGVDIGKRDFLGSF